MFRKQVWILIVAGLLLACGGGQQESRDNAGRQTTPKQKPTAGQAAAPKTEPKTAPQTPVVKMGAEPGGTTTSVIGPTGQKVETSTGDVAKMPEDFPTDVLVYKGDLVACTKVRNNVYLQFKCSDSAADVEAAYRKEMPAKGWQMERDMSGGGVAMLHYTKDGRRAMIHVVADPKGTAFSIAIEKPEAK
jgi:hypothetical protein